ncbi:MAG: hypothetical protein R3B51_01290 [Thermodesulfobacteriota bacterium]
MESVLYQHPDILEAAVVRKTRRVVGRDALRLRVTLKSDAPETSEKDIISFCRERLAHFKCPKAVVFMELPKTSTGRFQIRPPAI